MRSIHERYARYMADERDEDTVDDDSGLYHLAHEAWNRLAELELMLRSHEVDTP